MEEKTYRKKDCYNIIKDEYPMSVCVCVCIYVYEFGTHHGH